MPGAFHRQQSGFISYFFAALVAMILLLGTGTGVAADGQENKPDFDKTSPIATRLKFDPEDTNVPLAPEVLGELDPDRRFSLGLDRWAREDWAKLAHKRVAVATSRLAFDGEGRHLLETLLPQPKPMVSRVILFNDELAAPARTPKLNDLLASYPEVRVFERSAAGFVPSDSMLEGVDVILMDVPWRGGRFHPEAAFAGAVLREASIRGIKLVVLDRPTPVPALFNDGPLGDAQTAGTANNFLPAMAFPGMTLGELLTLYNTYYGLSAEMEVVEMTNWSRVSGCQDLLAGYQRQGVAPGADLEEWSEYYPATTATAIALMIKSLAPPTVGIEVGGATVPQGVIIKVSSPAIDAPTFEDKLKALQLPGLAPAIDGTVPATSSGSLLGLAIHPQEAQPVSIAVAIWSIAMELDPTIQPPADGRGLLGSAAVFEQLKSRRDPREIARRWQALPEYEEVLARRNKLLRYSR